VLEHERADALRGVWQTDQDGSQWTAAHLEQRRGWPARETPALAGGDPGARGEQPIGRGLDLVYGRQGGGFGQARHDVVVARERGHDDRYSSEPGGKAKVRRRSCR